MTIESFAAAAELDQDEVSEIVFGGVQPNTDTLARIAGTLHTTIDYLIGINEYEVSIETEEEKDIIQYFRKMSKRGQRQITRDRRLCNASIQISVEDRENEVVCELLL